ncbi:MAG: DUF1801 domain-containing protein [Planctomycetota bacterium]
MSGKSSKPKLLSGGNPQIAKADGNEPVQAYIEAMPGWKRDVGRWLDNVVTDAVPHVRKAVRWNTPFFGIEGQGWFLSCHCFTKHVKISFLNAGCLQPPPPESSKYEQVRSIHVREQDVPDSKQMTAWVKQASKAPGDNLF